MLINNVQELFLTIAFVFKYYQKSITYTKCANLLCNPVHGIVLQIRAFTHNERGNACGCPAQGHRGINAWRCSVVANKMWHK